LLGDLSPSAELLSPLPEKDSLGLADTFRLLGSRSCTSFLLRTSSAFFFFCCSLFRLASAATMLENSFAWLNMSCASVFGAVCHAAFLKPKRFFGGSAAPSVASVIGCASR
jgi:hypothetical protein